MRAKHFKCMRHQRKAAGRHAETDGKAGQQEPKNGISIFCIFFASSCISYEEQLCREILIVVVGQ